MIIIGLLLGIGIAALVRRTCSQEPQVLTALRLTGIVCLLGSLFFVGLYLFLAMKNPGFHELTWPYQVGLVALFGYGLSMSHIDRRSEKEKQAAALQEQIDELEGVNEESQGEIDDYQSEIDGLQEQIDENRGEIETREGEIAERDRQIADLRSQIAALTGEATGGTTTEKPASAGDPPPTGDGERKP